MLIRTHEGMLMLFLILTVFEILTTILIVGVRYVQKSNI